MAQRWCSMASASDKEQDGYDADFIRAGAPVEQFDELQADDRAGGDGSYFRSRVRDQTCHVPRGIRRSIHPMISLRCGLFLSAGEKPVCRVRSQKLVLSMLRTL